MHVAAVIPARGGSKGLPGKNLISIGGVPLVGRSVRAALAAARVDTVYCSSDDDAILACAAAHGAVPLRRPPEISGDTASSESALLHALSVMEADGTPPDILVFLQCTSPFTTGEDVDRLVAALDDPAFDAALIVGPSHAFLWRRDAEGTGRGINHDESLPRKRRQELEPEYRETGAGYAMRVPAFRAAGTRFCGPVALVESAAPPFEIDDAADLALAEAMAGAHALDSRARDALRDIRVLVTDFDGVHTDDRVEVGEDGLERVVCSRSDGFGIGQLRAAGFPVLILSREKNTVVARRADKLGVEVIHGVDDKAPLLGRWLEAHGLGWDQAAYVGNDANDIDCMTRARISFAPSDARPDALRAATHVLSRPGGHGAVREVCDLLLQYGPPAI